MAQQAVPVAARNICAECQSRNCVDSCGHGGGAIAGDVLMPFCTEGYEGFDVNQPLDWRVAELLVQEGQVRLPDVPCPPYSA
jgi:hypothetical protein